MPITAARAAHSNSQLIQRLCDLSVLGDALPHSRFVATVGKFIDFSEAMSVSDLLKDVSKRSLKEKPSDGSKGQTFKLDQVEEVQKHYLQARGDMMRFITQSFITEDCPVSLSLPLTTDADFSHQDQGLSSYQRFYSLHQSEMESRILKLQTTIRRATSASSPRLSQLVALDNKLSTILVDYSRAALGAIPVLLAKRFQYLCFERPSTKSSKTQTSLLANTSLESGLPTFLVEMQSVLLAELESRLQPTLGLIEALALEKEESTE